MSDNTVKDTKEGSNMLSSCSKETLASLPIPACTVDVEGKITYANAKMIEVFAYKGIEDSNFFALTGVKRGAFFENGENGGPKEILISRNDNYFVLHTNTDASEDSAIVVYFMNVSQRERLKIKTRDEQTCLLYISIDNYDEVVAAATADSRMAVPIEVDRRIMRWAEQFDALIESTGEETYVMTVLYKDAERIIENRFQVLDDVREIDTKIDFPVSLSIGMGIGGESLRETTELAEAAFELARGRGGDQAVVKNGDNTSYYGGRLMSYEKNNRGKSRIIAHALKQLILDSEEVYIMGHRWPDMDAFGAALATYRICDALGKDASIVLEEYNEALSLIFKQAKELDEYEIITRSKAIDDCNEKSLLIVLDTTRPGMVECPELLKKAGQIVLIDHHRLSEDSIEGATLSYVESYASSTCELMAEIMQYSSNKRLATKFEAEAMLAGIMIDTNSFSIKTGARTFEAAAWLKRAGADTTEVKRFFQFDLGTFLSKADAIAGAEFFDNGIAIAVATGLSTDAAIINSQVADEILSVKGVKAVFAIGKVADKTIAVSARSLGEVNVQMIMEKFNGGGHLNSAGAQLEMEPEEFKAELKRVLDEYFEQSEEEDE